jgi:6-phosphogluconolactonase
MKRKNEGGWITGSDEAVTERAAVFITALAYRALAERGRFTMALAGGGTPRSLYGLLARGIDEKILAGSGYGLPAAARRSPADPRLVTLPWRHTLLFQGDERYVPAAHPDSNYGVVRETLIRHICIPPQHIVRMPVESGDARGDALRYEQLLRGLFRRTEGRLDEGFPEFDLVMLGLGDDGHTASLFPGDREALEESSRWVLAVEARRADPPGTRLTLTLPVINHAAAVMFLVPEKRHELARSIHDGLRPDLPAGMVKPAHGELFWFVAGG